MDGAYWCDMITVTMGDDDDDDKNDDGNNDNSNDGR